MANDSVQPLGSMGTDTPLAVLSNKPQLLYNYFKQLFAQVTNRRLTPSARKSSPPRKPWSARRATCLSPPQKLPHDPAGASHPHERGPRKAPARGPRRLQTGHAADSVQGGGRRPGFGKRARPIVRCHRQGNCRRLEHHHSSDRGISAENAPIPALLALSGLHHHLIRQGTRTRVGLVLESGEPREVHHFALLIGYGCSAINPYLAYDSLDDMIARDCSWTWTTRPP